MNKKKTGLQKTLRQELMEKHNVIEETVVFWEDRMNTVIDKMSVTDQLPDWHPNKEDSYHELNMDMQFILKKLESEEKEIDSLEEKTNRLLADKLFRKFKRVDGRKKEEN
jgi:uncharacterized protein YbcC (UPF0753/DUF2309 family)